MSKTHAEMLREFETDSINIIQERKEVSLDKGEKYRKSLIVKDEHGKEFSVKIDIYDVLKAFNVTNPATQHAIKKLLSNGERGHKNLATDLKEARWSIERAIELEGF